jgi:alcohol dehydrogenase
LAVDRPLSDVPFSSTRDSLTIMFMKALYYEQFGGDLRIAEMPEPAPAADGVVIEVRACGVCRSDWHGWQGHDPDIKALPHVPGHELAGVVAEVGCEVSRWRVGDRVTMPFVAGCGKCPECASGNEQVCDRQFQPGFTAWGAFAERVAVRYSDGNLVRLPEELGFVAAASLGCRLSTAYRAVVLQGKLQAGQWVVVHGCGGLGLSALMIATALGARVIGIDIQASALEMAKSLGAEAVIDATVVDDVPQEIHKLTGRGADLSLDTLGSRITCGNSIRCLRKRGRHVQVGLLVGDDASPPVPLELALSRELELVGSHGLQASYYSELFRLIELGKLNPSSLVRSTIALSEAPGVFADMGTFTGHGITVVNQF